jgi:hypothetical protein
MDSKPTQGVEKAPQTPISQEQIRGGLEGFAVVTPELGVEPIPGERMNAATAAVQQAVATAPIQGAQGVQLSDDTTSSQSANAIADDNDVIEKEWIDKAKKIVAETAGDPHLKTKKLTVLKKDYIEKRYGKQIKIAADESGI